MVRIPLYITTMLFRIFAYGWLLFVLAGTSNSIVEVWEATVTVGLFILLVICSYIADKQFCCRKKVGTYTDVEKQNRSMQMIHSPSGTALYPEIDKEARKMLAQNSSPEQVAAWRANQIQNIKMQDMLSI